jgi:hypothetical protein
MDDFQTIFEMWLNPQTNMTTWRKYITEMLQNDIRYKNFRKNIKSSKKLSSLYHVFYYRMKISNIGLSAPKKISKKCLKKVLNFLDEMPDHSAVQETVGYYLITYDKFQTSTKNGNKAKILFSKSAYQGYKPAIRHLATSSMFMEGVGTPELFKDFEDDPFYELCFYNQKIQNDINFYPNVVDAIIKLQMPLNEFSFTVSFLLCLWYMELANEKKIGGLIKPHFIRLCDYLSLYLTKTRILPLERDPFNTYFNEYDSNKKIVYKNIIDLYNRIK